MTKSFVPTTAGQGGVGTLAKPWSVIHALDVNYHQHAYFKAVQTATGDGTTTIDWGLGNMFKFTFGAQNETFTFTAPDGPTTCTLWLTQDGVGSRTVTWPTMYWGSNGTVPTLSTGAGDIDIIILKYDGTNWWGGVGDLDFVSV
jgi:hypothetical protein